MSKPKDKPPARLAGKQAGRRRPARPQPRRSAGDATGIEGFEHWKLPNLDFPSFRLSLVAKIMDRLSFRQLAGIGNLSFAEWRVLSRLAISREGLTVRQIADLAWVDRAEVSRAAAALEVRGLTARRDNPRDRRTPILYATREGLALHDPVMRARRRFHAAVTADLDEAERRQLDELLVKLARRLLRMAADRAG
jgi:DNA-binding MarR family transcriptional regulator